MVFRTEPATNQNFTRYFEVICWPTIGLRAASDGAAEVITALAGRRTHSKNRACRVRRMLSPGAPTIYNGMLFRVTIDSNLVALDMKTGKQIWTKIRRLARRLLRHRRADRR